MKISFARRHPVVVWDLIKFELRRFRAYISILLINKTPRQLAINLHFDFLVSFFSPIVTTF